MKNHIQFSSAIYNYEKKPPKKYYCEIRLIEVFLNSTMLVKT